MMNYNYFVFNKVTGEKVKSFCTMWEAFDYASDLNDKAELTVYSISREIVE